MIYTNVLIVDDDTVFSDSFRRLLESSYGLKDIHTCSNEKEAIETVNKSFDGYTHIFVDCIIPGSDGVSLSKTLHKLNTEKNSNASMFLLSGFVDASTLPDDLSYVSETFKKPIVKDKLSKYFERHSVITRFDFFSKYQTIEELIVDCNNNEYAYCEDFIPILSQLIQLEFSGKILLTTSKTNSSAIFMSDGEFNYIIGNNYEDRFGEQLIKNGYILPAPLNQALEKTQFNEGNPKIGNFLIQKNLLSPHAVDEVIKIQTENRFEKILKYKNFKVNLIEQNIEKKNKTLSFPDYFKFIEKNFNLKNSLMFGFSKKSIAEAPRIYPTPQFAMLKNSHNLSLNAVNIELAFLLILTGAATLQESDETTNIATKSILNSIEKILNMDDPYTVFGIEEREKATDSIVAKLYYKIARKIHPDKLQILNLNPEEKKLVVRGFAKLTSDFNKIKTTSKRQNLQARGLLEKEKGKKLLEEMITNTTKLLHKGHYLEAGKIVKSIHAKYPDANHKQLSIITLWADLKSNEEVDVKSAKETLDRLTSVEKTPLDYYLYALLCKASGDRKGFMENLTTSTKINDSFLPARRELIQFKSEIKKTQVSKKSSSYFFGSLLSKKSS